VTTQAAQNAGIRVGDYLVRFGGREVKTCQDVHDAVRETSENGEIRCRFHRRHVEGEDTWIDIAKNREVWTDVVYELFHNAKTCSVLSCFPHVFPSLSPLRT
jgi:C-terminal processing protease CtpA/Prc